MRKKLFLPFFLSIFIISFFAPVSGREFAGDANDAVEQFSSGVISEDNLNLDFDRTGVPKQVKTSGINVWLDDSAEYRVGESKENGDGTVDRIMYLSFKGSANIYTAYNLNSIGTVKNELKSIRYMKVATFTENWVGGNGNADTDSYYLKYNDYRVDIGNPGFDGNLKLNAEFQNSDFEARTVQLGQSDYEFTTNNIYGEITEINTNVAEQGFVDTSGNFNMQTTNTVSKSTASHTSDKNDDPTETTPSYQSLSSKLGNAGYIRGSSKTFYKNTGNFGNVAFRNVVQGPLKKTNGKYMLDTHIEPQAQTLREQFSYKQITSARSNYISICTNTDVVGRDPGEATWQYAEAQLKNRVITRDLGVEVYNSYIKLDFTISVKIVANTELTYTCIGDDETIQDPEMDMGEAYYGNEVSQSSADIQTSESPGFGSIFESMFGFDFGWVIAVIVIVVVIGGGLYLYVMIRGNPLVAAARATRR